MEWLLAANVREKMESVEGRRVDFLKEQAAFESEFAIFDDDDKRIMTVDDGVARLKIQGIMTKKPDWMAAFFGGGNVTYSQINGALAKAELDDSIKSIDIHIDSPGGTVDGLFDTIAAMQSLKKPTRAIVDGMAASAAYAVASQTQEIIATNKVAQFGSIGVVASYYKSANIYDITSTKSPKKRPDPATEEGQAVIREHLDALHELFVEAIAVGRDKTTDLVNSSFGEGAMLLAGEALNRGMIDKLEGSQPVRLPSSTNATAKSGQTQEFGKMDLKTLKAQHPEVYDMAVETGVKKERERVDAHLTAGEISGDMKTALQCAKDGSDMTMSLQTKYMMQAANRRSQADREADDKATEEALKSADTSVKSAADAEREKVAAVVFEQLGMGA